MKRSNIKVCAWEVFGPSVWRAGGLYSNALCAPDRIVVFAPFLNNSQCVSQALEDLYIQ